MRRTGIIIAALMLSTSLARAQNYLRDDGIFHSVVEGTSTGQLLGNTAGALAGINVGSGLTLSGGAITLNPILPPGALPWYDVRNYAVSPEVPNTVCTGPDDTATIQAALTAAAANPFGQTVVLPAGVCKISSPGLSMSGGTRFTGQGAGNTGNPTVTQLLYTSAIGSILKLDGQVGYELDHMQVSYNAPAYNGDLIDARQISGPVLSTGIHIHDFSITGTQGVATGANSLLRVGNTLDVHVHDGFMQMAARGIYTDGTQPTNDFNLHNIWFQSLTIMPVTWGNGLGWNVHDNIFEPLIAGAGFAGYSNALASTGTCASCSFDHNGVQDGTNLGTAVDLSGGAMIGGSVSKNTLQGALVAANFGSSSGVTVGGNYLNAASGTNGFFAAASASKMDVFPNYVSTNLGPGAGVIFTAAGFPANSRIDNNDGFGIRFTGPIVLSTSTLHGVLLGGGASASISSTAAMTAGQLLVGQTGADPVPRTVSGDATLSLAGAMTFNTVNSTVGTFGDGTHVAQVTVNGKGLVTAASSVAITGAAPTGAAGGDLTGTYPNPTIATAAVTYAKIANIGALSVMGRSANSSGVGADISATASSSAVLRESGGVLGFGTVALAGLQFSTISGVSLGSNLFTLTFGTHLAAGGASYNGSGAITITSDATSANTASTIVARDGSGNFSAGTISAALSGNATTATSATSATNASNGATVSTSTNATFFPLFVASSANSNQVFNLGAGLSFNPSTNNLATSSFNKVTITPPASGSTLSVPDGVVFTGPASSGTAMTLGNAETVTGAKTFSTAPVFNALPTGTAVATANTVSTLVARDGSGNFSAGTVTASLTGHASLDLALTGGTMSGAIAMGANNITGGGTITGTVFTSTDTTNSTSISTGAIKTAGGLQVAKSATFGSGAGTVNSGPVPDITFMSANSPFEMDMAAGGANPFVFQSTDAASYFIFDINRRTATGVFQNTSATHQRLQLLSGNGSGSIVFAATNTNNSQAPTVFTVLGSGDTLTAGHVLAAGTAPTVSSCGVSPSISGSDNFGTVTAGTGILAACVINFAKTWGAAPRCVASSGTAIASMTVSATTTQLTIGGTSLTGDVINWVCGSTS